MEQDNVAIIYFMSYLLHHRLRMAHWEASDRSTFTEYLSAHWCAIVLECSLVDCVPSTIFN